MLNGFGVEAAIVSRIVIRRPSESPSSVKPVRRNFVTIRSGISRSVRRTNFATTLKPMHPPRRNFADRGLAVGWFHTVAGLNQDEDSSGRRSVASASGLDCAAKGFVSSSTATWTISLLLFEQVLITA